MLTQRNICLSLQCSPFTLTARRQWVPPDTSTHTQYSVPDIDLAVLLPVLVPTSVSSSLSNSIYALYGFVFMCRLRIFLFHLPPSKALQIQSPWKQGVVSESTSWHLLYHKMQTTLWATASLCVFLDDLLWYVIWRSTIIALKAKTWRFLCL